MSKRYKHLWMDDDNKSFMQEGTPAEDIKASINDYKQEADLFPYSHTLVWDLKEGTCESINIEEIIEEEELEDRKIQKEDLMELRSNIDYFSWAQVGGRNY